MKLYFRHLRNNAVVNLYRKEKTKKENQKLMYDSFMKLVMNVESLKYEKTRERKYDTHYKHNLLKK